MKLLSTYFYSFLLICLITACSDDFLERKPVTTDTQVNGADAVKTEKELNQLLVSVYDVAANLYGGQIQNLGELLGDDVDSPVSQNDYIQIYTRRTDIFNGTISGVYKDAYLSIYRSNVVIEKLNEISGISSAEKTRIEAEARFLRALNHYSISRLFAQPPGYTSNNSHSGIVTRMKLSQDAGLRTSLASNYEEILSDLDFAEANLPSENGVFATKWAAKALKARMYLGMNNYTKAAQYADEVINSGLFTLLDSLNRFTSTANSEQIFFTVSTNAPAFQDERGDAFLNYRSDNNANPTMRASEDFYGFVSADTNDLRGKNWFKVINPGNTKGVSKFNRTFMWIPILHLTEMKLTRAEALAALGTDVTTATNDVNEIRTRAGLEPLDGVTGAALVNAIRDERRKEMCFEGDRTTQIKRIGALGFESFSRGAPWNCPGMVLQFPGAENTVIGFELNPTGGCN
jgi:hypothetical protein